MNTRLHIGLRSTLVVFAVLTWVVLSSPVRADGPYLAMAGQNKTIELLRLTDLTKVAAIDVSPMKYPSLKFLPLTRHLYAFEWDLSGPGVNTVLDFGTCSSGLLRPMTIPNPTLVGANGDETKLFIGSEPGLLDGVVSENKLYILDPSTDTVTGVLTPSTLGTGYPKSIFFDSTNGTLYVGGDIYDSTLTFISRCNFPDSSTTIVTRGKAYVPNTAYADIYDLTTCNYLGEVRFPAHGYGSAAARTRAGDKVYILTNMDSEKQGNPNFLSENALVVIDTLTDQASALPLGREIGWQNGLVLNADETQAYIAVEGLGAAPNAVGVLDLQTGVLQQYPIDTVPSWPWSLALIDKLGFQCGDGVVDSACGEQCDPPGSIVNGTVCDVNCTMGCGNGIVSGSEQCDDGNTNDNDACKNDCTLNICGDGVVNRGVEQCDHGAANGTPGDACSATCTLPPRTASGDVPAGGTLTTDVEGDGATASAPVETWVTSPVAGPVIIEEGVPDPTMPSGYAFLGYSVHITVASSTPDNPIVLVFEIASSLLPPGSNQTAVEFSKNGVLVSDCIAGGSSANPDPCVASRELLGNGNLRVTIRSSSASFWGGVAPLHDARVYKPRVVSLVISANKLVVTRKMAIRVRNADRIIRSQKRSTPIQLTATNVDCPLGLIADVPDFYPRQPFAQDTVILAPRHNATARLRLVASRFAFPTGGSPHHCTIRLSAAALVADNVDPTPLNNTTTVQVTVKTR